MGKHIATCGHDIGQLDIEGLVVDWLTTNRECEEVMATGTICLDCQRTTYKEAIEAAVKRKKQIVDYINNITYDKIIEDHIDMQYATTDSIKHKIYRSIRKIIDRYLL